MRRELLKTIKPVGERNRLHVEVYHVLGNESGDPVGVGYSIVSVRVGPGKPDRWWTNIHPAEIDELISMLEDARESGKDELKKMEMQPPRRR